MSRALIESTGDDLLCSVAVGGAKLRLSYAAAAGRLMAWSAPYDTAAARDVEAELLTIGQKTFAWLNTSDWNSGWVGEALCLVIEDAVPAFDQNIEHDPVLIHASHSFAQP